MRRFNLGVWPSFILGSGLFVVGVLTLNHIVNQWWLFDVSRIDLLRGVSTDTIQADSLLEASNLEILGAFLGTVLLTITGIVLPLAFVLNKQFVGEEPNLFVLLRQAMWVGTWVTFCLWLQMHRTFGIAIAGLVAVVFVLLETLLQIRSRTHHMLTPVEQTE